jgi:heat-inducible transcriptional repressor
MDISKRQQQILAAIVEQYAEVASPVGSVVLAKLFDVSPATIRSEMVRLESLGYIKQPHTSAGRIPTDAGYRFYVNGITEENPSVRKPTTIRAGQVIDRRVTNAGAPEQVIRSAVNSLSEMTRNVGLATLGPTIYTKGLEQLFAQPEFIDGSGMRAVGYLLDNLDHWLREAAPTEPHNVYIGAENPIGKSSQCSLIISRFRSPYSDSSYIGVLGPTRQSYRQVMSLVKHTAASLEEAMA